MDDPTHSESERPRLQVVTHQTRHVFVDYFDPPGARRLSRTLSSLPQARARQSDDSSDETLAVGENFDFERLVKRYLHKYVCLLLCISMSSAFFRRDESEIKPRQLGVMFENLRVVGLGASASFQPTLGSLFNPMNVVHAVQMLRHPPLRDILSGFEGVVRPGEMLCK